jgi:hypothetical protein
MWFPAKKILASNRTQAVRARLSDLHTALSTFH